MLCFFLQSFSKFSMSSAIVHVICYFRRMERLFIASAILRSASDSDIISLLNKIVFYYLASNYSEFALYGKIAQMSNLQTFAREPWDRLSAEDDFSWESFRLFRDTPPLERVTLLPIISEKFGKSQYEIKDIAKKHNWLSRVGRFDIWKDASQRLGALARRREIGKEMVKFGQVMMTRANEAMKKLEDKGELPSYRESVEMARLGIELQRSGFLALGISERTHTEGEVIPGISDPSELVEQAIQIQAIITKRTVNVKNEDIEGDNVIDGDYEESEAQ